MAKKTDYNKISTEKAEVEKETPKTSIKKAEPKTAKKKAMLSQPMRDKTDKEIKAARDQAVKVLEELGYEVVNTLFTDEWYSDAAMEDRGVVNKPLCFLAKSLENMANCHVAYFCGGWKETRGCVLEHEVAKAYGLEIIYETASVVKCNLLNVRKEPVSDGAILATVPVKGEVRILKKNVDDPDWVFISYVGLDGEEVQGYVMATYLQEG